MSTAWFANELGSVGPDTTVAIWGAGPGTCQRASVSASQRVQIGWGRFYAGFAAVSGGPGSKGQ